MNLPYRLAARLFHHIPLPSGKLKESRSGRAAATERWLQWARQSPAGAPLVWVHAASVGEAQVTEPVARRLCSKYPQIRVIQTYSSPSAANWPLSAVIERSDYLPPEHPIAVGNLFTALRPRAVVVSRGDIWPELVHGAYEHGVPVAVVGGMVRPSSLRLRWPVRKTLESIYRRLAFVGAVSSDHAQRWIRLGTPSEVVCVTGDPRDDYILERNPHYAALISLITWTAAGPTLVAGSTHRRDERVLIEAFSRVCATRPDARVIFVPHEAEPELAGHIASMATNSGLVAAAWNGRPPPSNARVLVITRSGILADVYMLGCVAYVGGGFDASGVHSLAEPAAYGIASLTGPAAARDQTARRFFLSGGAVAIDARDPVASLAERWSAWLSDSASRNSAGVTARQQLDAGSARRTAEALGAMLERSF